MNAAREGELDKIFPCDCSFTKGFAYKKGDPCDGTCALAPYKERVIALFEQQEKQIRVNELKHRAEDAIERMWRVDREAASAYVAMLPEFYRITKLPSQETT